MTIKQQGGVFGRNPTFNNVEVDGTATLDNIASSDKLRVTASDNPAAYIEFENTFQNAGIATQAGLLLGVNSSVQTNYAGVIATEQATNSNGVLLGLYANNGAGPILVAQARNNKNFEIVDGDLVVASGHGIDFSATSGTGTSELFDDYEEGTWTVELYDAASGGNISPTTVTGNYTKIGNVVVATFFNLADIDTTGMTGASSLWITIPFTSSSAASGSVAVDSITFPAGKTSLSLSLGSSSARMRILLSGSATVDSAIPVGNLTSGTSDIVHATITYIAS